MLQKRVLSKSRSLQVILVVALAIYILFTVVNLGIQSASSSKRSVPQDGTFKLSIPSYAVKSTGSWNDKETGKITERVFGRPVDQLKNVTTAKLAPANPQQLPPVASMNAVPFMRDEHYKPSICPKTVSTLTRYSKWFKERYKPDIKIFLEQSDISNVSAYGQLLHYGLPFGFKSSNKTQLITIANHPNFTNAPLNTKGAERSCTTCAVIGCGGILNGSRAGQEIDSHNYVFRLNRALSSGRHAEDVGHKTSFYTFFPESMHITDVEDKNASFFYTMFKPYDVDYAINLLSDQDPPKYISRGKVYKMRKPSVDRKKLKIIHPDFFRYVFTKYLDTKSVRPTTGAVVAILALHLCDEVAIYGFGYDSRFTLHYYDKKFTSHTKSATALHDVDNERELWHKLHDEGIIRLFKRDS